MIFFLHLQHGHCHTTKGKNGWEREPRSLLPFGNHSVSGTSAHTVPGAPDNIISYHRRGEIPPVDIPRIPAKGISGVGRDLMETASSKFRGSASRSGVISTFSHSLSSPLLTITAKTLCLFRRLTGWYSTGTGLNRSAEPARRPRPIKWCEEACAAAAAGAAERKH